MLTWRIFAEPVAYPTHTVYTYIATDVWCTYVCVCLSVASVQGHHAIVELLETQYKVT